MSFAAADAMHGRDVFLAIPPHRRCRCLYDELEECIRSHKDNAEVLEKHRIFLEEEGYPRQMGLTENNVIYRKHRTRAALRLWKTGGIWLRTIRAAISSVCFTYCGRMGNK